MRSRTPARQRAPIPLAMLALSAGALMLAGCVEGRGPSGPAPSVALGGRLRAYNRPYQVRGRWYTPRAEPGYDALGLASWYSYESPSRTTADGEPFDIRTPSAAHTTLPIPSWLEVTNLDNGRRARVRLNDRGPFVAGRLLDVSRAAAVELGFVQQGTARVRVRYLGPAAPLGGAAAMLAAAGPSLPARPAHAAVAQVARAENETAPPAQVQPADVEADVAIAPAPRLSPDIDAARFEVQVAAFADRANAERAVARLSSAGRPYIEPMQRGETVLYRVLVGAWRRPVQAETARGEVLALGFTDARVIMH